MSVLEVIHLRMAGRNLAQVLALVREGSGGAQGAGEVKVYRNAQFDTDVLIHLCREVQRGDQGTSPLGVRLAALLREHGIVEHSVWLGG